MQSLRNKNNRLLRYQISVINTMQSLSNKNNRLLRYQIFLLLTQCKYLEIRITDY